MRNIKLTIEYDGTGFCGWQTQRVTKTQGHQDTRTVQEEIEKAAKKLFNKKINLIGAGRTDSGVHARAQAANFRVDSKLPLNNIKRGLNKFLPRSIAVTSAEEAPLKFHARFDAREKLYKYTIFNRKWRSPLSDKHAAFVSYDLDVAAMRKAAGYLVGKKDFKSFQASDKSERSSVKTVKRLDIKSRPPLIEIYIQADGFLYNMVRNIAGTLIEAGRGRLKPEDVKEILRKKHRSSAGQTAPAKGLCLEEIIY